MRVIGTVNTMKLTIDQLAQRATKKRNNRTRRELPLLAAIDAIPVEWLTTEDAQKTRIERQHKGSEEWFKEFDRRRAEERLLAERLKAEVRELVDDEERFGELVRGMRHIEHCGPEYHLDYWRRTLARLDPKYCPHYKNDHQVCRILEHDICPVCLVDLTNRKAGKND